MHMIYQTHPEGLHVYLRHVVFYLTILTMFPALGHEPRSPLNLIDLLLENTYMRTLISHTTCYIIE